MFGKPYHGWRIKPEITAIRRLSPPLPLPPLFFYCHRHTHNLPPPTSHFRFTSQTTTSPLSTSSLATGPSAAAVAAAAAAAAACYSPAPEPNVESLRESHDDGGEGDGEGFGTLPDKRSLLFTCVSEDGTCKVYVFPTKHSSQELCGEVVEVITYVRPQVVATRLYPAYASMLEWLKRNPKVVNMLEVHPRDDFHVASEELKKYGGKGGLSEQVANILEVYLGRGFRVAYEKAMDNGIKVALCGKMSLSAKIGLIRASLMFEAYDIIMEGPWKRQANPSRFSRLWRLCLLQLLEWIQSGIRFGRKKRNEMRQFCRITFGDGQGSQGRHKDRSQRDP